MNYISSRDVPRTFSTAAVLAVLAIGMPHQVALPLDCSEKNSALERARTGREYKNEGKQCGTGQCGADGECELVKYKGPSAEDVQKTLEANNPTKDPDLADVVRAQALANPEGKQVWNDPGCVIVSCVGEPPLDPGFARIVTFPNDPETINRLADDIPGREVTAMPRDLRSLNLLETEARLEGYRTFQSYDDTTEASVQHVPLRMNDLLKTPTYISPVPPGDVYEEGRGWVGHGSNNTEPDLSLSPYSYPNSSTESFGEHPQAPPPSSTPPPSLLDRLSSILSQIRQWLLCFGWNSCS